MPWKFDLVEDEAVFQTLRAQQPWVSDLKFPRMRFYRNYLPHRELYVDAARVCWRFGWKPEEPPVLLHA